jgi:pyridinium-3,5-bisthiocarboxylic acid mononucleotide nickel chelatase
MKEQTALLVEPFAGVSGNMLLGALLDLTAGIEASELESALEALAFPEQEAARAWQMERKTIVKGGIAATHMDFHIQESHHHRHLSDIIQLIEGSSLPQPVKQNSIKVFNRLGQAEATVHGTSIESVHFHEVGAIDAILDIVGFCWAVERLGIQQIYSTALPLPRGSIQCAHGRFPNPGPATTWLMQGIPSTPVDFDREMVTPTGAAILTTLAKFTLPTNFRSESIGYGAGSMEFPFPNVLRIQRGFSSDWASVISSSPGHFHLHQSPNSEAHLHSTPDHAHHH